MRIRTLSLALLAVLLVLELSLQYDSLERQIALSLTNVFGVSLYLGVIHYFKRRSITLPEWLWLLVVVGIGFDAIGNFAHLYARFHWWDQLVHLVGPALIGVIVVSIFRQFQRDGIFSIPLRWHNLVVISVAMFFTVLYEISEYFGDLLFHTNRIPVLFDTADDLWWGLVAISIVTYLSNRKSGSKSLTDAEKMV